MSGDKALRPDSSGRSNSACEDKPRVGRHRRESKIDAIPDVLSAAVEWRPTASLKPRTRNARTHSDRQIRQLAASMRQFGFTNPVLIDEAGGILAGHARVDAAKQLGMQTVPTLRLDRMTGAQKRAYVIADNKLAELAGWDNQLLALEFQELIELDFDVEVTGFETAEIDLLIESEQPDEADEIPEIPTDPVSRLGDLWQLGPHRLVCADALEPGSYDQLMGGEKARVCFIDPPYNVPIPGHVSGQGRHKHENFAMASGEMSEAEFVAFLSKLFQHLVDNSVDGALTYVAIDWAHIHEVLAASKGTFSELKTICVWNKDNAGMGSLYRSKHELFPVFKSGTAPHVNNIQLGRYGRYRTNVWDYTRKSSEEGLDQAFNSLDAQREACEAFIKSQIHQGWRALPEHYDDGGFSGGTVERPALQRLLDQVRSRKVDVIVVYKIDRLTRSLADFARLAELFDQNGVSFVSVTQQFNTTTSMGRLTLNVLLSFAQFEREVAGERIRDKIAASKKKGMWMGGNVPLGYDVVDRKLVVNKSEAETVRTMFRLYLEKGNVREVQAEAQRLGLRTKQRSWHEGRRQGGLPFYRSHIYHLLKSPIYVGMLPHKGKTHPGDHEAIIDQKIWDAVQAKLADNLQGHRKGANFTAPSLLKGLLVDTHGHRFTPSHCVKHGRRYRYYVEQALTTADMPISAKLRRIPAAEIEEAVLKGLADLLTTPDLLLKALGKQRSAVETERVIREGKRLAAEILKGVPSVQSELLRQVVNQVVIEDGGLRLRVPRERLHAVLEASSPHRDAGVAKRKVESTERFDHLLVTQLTTSGLRTKMVMGNGLNKNHEPDHALIKSIARGYVWFDQLATGKASSVREVAAVEKVAPSYITRLIRLSLVAPHIIESIMDGRTPNVGASASLIAEFINRSHAVEFSNRIS